MAWTDDPISDPQVAFIRDLVSKRDISGLPQDQQAFINPQDEDKQLANLKRMTKGQASECINILKACPYPQAPQTATNIQTPQTPVQGFEMGSEQVVKSQQYQPYSLALGNESREGRFFIVDPTDGKEKFFHVHYGKEDTRWAGHVFLEVRASDDLYPVKDPKHRAAIFAEINKDPITAMNEYGIRLEECGVCGRTLTDRDSRLRGIGPICAAKLGPTSEQSHLLRTLGLIKDE